MQANKSSPILTWAWACAALLFVGTAMAEPMARDHDPALIKGPDACGKECHKDEAAVWIETKHAVSFRTLEQEKKVGEILTNMGLKGSMRRAEPCQGCHYTLQMVNGHPQATAGVSCEACHRPSKDWIDVHGDYGGKDVKRDQETPDHKQQRLARSAAAGMVRPVDLYPLVRTCFDCHLGVEEKLVNTGGHVPGSLIELVSWTQGKVGEEGKPIRHNLHQSKENRYSPPARRRIMYVLGLSLELEYTLRAIGRATQDGLFIQKMAKQAKQAAQRLKQVNEKVAIPEVAAIIAEAGKVKLKLNNGSELNPIADVIAAQGRQFAARADGDKLAAMDAVIPWYPEKP
ncbi:MAG: cytochrome C554 [Magnetococcales bacterium]|nr:cytochrome C554 [Magnetococcales bacterium]